MHNLIDILRVVAWPVATVLVTLIAGHAAICVAGYWKR